ncbi:MAG: hypothetical protein GY751_27115 [Bacteroidetes bacterium]|nr:hypothetical protein [Bacteroidota bacterium]
MHITINVPDSLPQERLWQRIREIEESLRQEAKFIEKMGIKEADHNMPVDDPLASPDSNLLSDNQIFDFGRNTDTEDQEEDQRLFLESFGSWEDSRTAEEIVKDIYNARKSVERDIKL